MNLKTICVIIVGSTNMMFGQQHENKNSTRAKALIEKVVLKTGNYDLLKQLKDVEFEYTFYSPLADKKDISIERYIFDGEVSYGSYHKHQVYVYPNALQNVTQYYDGESITKVTLGNEIIKDESIVQKATFLRKANFYWFTMMPKLLDKGVIYTSLPKRTYNNIAYDIVKIAFEKEIGAVQDEFMLYINPKTLLIDRFIFTVKGSGLGLLIMEADYETVNGYTFMAKRKVLSGANWDGSYSGSILFEQYSTNVKFTNGFTKEFLRSTK